jgi:hypothetical protein
VLEGFLVGIIDASLLRKAMQSCSGVDRAFVVDWASVDAEGSSAFEGISVVAKESSVATARSIRVAVVLSSIVWLPTVSA